MTELPGDPVVKRLAFGGNENFHTHLLMSRASLALQGMDTTECDMDILLLSAIT